MRGLLDIESLARPEIEAILARSKDFQPAPKQPFKRFTTLQNRMVVNLFFESSTRTRTSFEIAARRLGAEVLSIAVAVDGLVGAELVHAGPLVGRDFRAFEPRDGAWQRLQAFSSENPTLKLIDSGRPEKSYLWLKLAGDGSIVGSRMPLDPLGSGSRSLPQDQLDSIQTWILAGALND